MLLFHEREMYEEEMYEREAEAMAFYYGEVLCNLPEKEKGSEYDGYDY